MLLTIQLQMPNKTSMAFLSRTGVSERGHPLPDPVLLVLIHNLVDCQQILSSGGCFETLNSLVV